MRILVATLLVCTVTLIWRFPAREVVRYSSGQEAHTVGVVDCDRNHVNCQAVWVFPSGSRGSGEVRELYNPEGERSFTIFAGEDWAVSERSHLLWSAARQLTLIVPAILIVGLLGRKWLRKHPPRQGPAPTPTP